MRMTILAICLVGWTSGCATTDQPAAERPRASLFAIRGQEVADLRCAGCHSIDTITVSPRFNAPPFRDLRIRFNAISWERKMAEIAEGGHDEMPAVRLDDIEIRDLRAYIESLR